MGSQPPQRQEALPKLLSRSLLPAYLRFDGAELVEIGANGTQVLHTAGGNVLQEKPFTYQEVNGVREEVASRFVLTETGEVRFEVGA